MRPLTCGMPKPIVPVLNRPLLEHILLNLVKIGVKEVVLTVSHMPDAIRDKMGDGSQYGIRLYYVHEETALGTSGAIKNAERFLDGPFFVFNGDILTTINLDDMAKRHLEVRPKVTIALTPVENPIMYGIVETDEHGMVQRFVEKPTWDKVTTNLINAGIYILETDVLKYIPPGTPSMFENYVFPKLLEVGEPFLGYPADGYWIDIGTPEKYLKVNLDLLEQRGKSIFTEGESRIDPAAEIEPPVLIGSGCDIAAGAKIKGPAVLGPGCTIAENANIENSVLWEGVRICTGSSIKKCVIGERSYVQEDCRLEDCILGAYVVVGKGTTEWEAKIPPKTFVSPRT
ncbi:MAG: NDP-sugar synthase [Chloroflexi bacterium]|nr:NDP-sugar synthase [Chloroflexota bacterium]